MVSVRITESKGLGFVGHGDLRSCERFLTLAAIKVILDQVKQTGSPSAARRFYYEELTVLLFLCPLLVGRSHRISPGRLRIP